MSDERERMAEIIADSIDMDWKPGYAADALIAAGFGDVAKARAEMVAAIEIIKKEHDAAIWEAEVDMNNGLLVELRYAGEWLDRVEEAIRALAQPKEPGE